MLFFIPNYLFLRPYDHMESLYRVVRPTVQKKLMSFAQILKMYPSRANRNWQIFHFMSRLLWVSSQEDIYCGVKWKKSEVGRAGKKGESTGRAVQVTRSASFAWETRP